MTISFLVVTLGALLTVCCTAVNKPWESVWKRVVLNPDISASSTLLAKVLDLPDDLRKEVIDGKSAGAKYTPVKFDERTAPLCRVLFDLPITSDDGTLTSSHFSYCSCSFVSPTIAMIAAHSVSRDETRARILRSKYLVYVVQEYGKAGKDMAAHKEHTRKNAKLVTEVWFPESWQEKWATEGFAHRPMDMAFIKVDATRPATSHYELMLSTFETSSKASSYTILGKEMIAVGYPQDQKKGEEAITYAGSVTDQTKWKVDGKMQLLPFQLALNGKMFQNWAITSGGMEGGGSGGPWILTDAALKQFKDENLRLKLRMGVFGLTSFGDDTDGARERVSPMFTPRILEAFSKIRAASTKNPFEPSAGTSFLGKDPNSKKIDRVEFALTAA